MAIYKNIEEYRRKKRNKKIICNILLAVLIVGTLFVLLNVLEVFKGSKLNQMIISTQKKDKVHFPLAIKNEQLVDIYSVGSNISVLTKSSILTYSSNGIRQKSILHGYTNPVMKEGGKRVLTYDRGGKKFRVDSRSSCIGEVILDSSIISADIISSGRVAVLMSHQSNLPVVIVYNENLEPIYKYFTVEDFTSVSLSNDGNHVAASKIISPNGNLSARIYELDITKTTDAAISTISNILPLSISYQSDGGLLVVGKDSTVFLNGNVQKRFDYSGAIQHFVFASREGAVLVNEDIFSNYSTVSLITKDAMPKKTIKINDEVLDVYSDGGRILLLCKRSAFNFDMSLLQLNEIPLSTTYRKIIYIGQSAYVMGEDTINKYPID